jgi:hypothetical protein
MTGLFGSSFWTIWELDFERGEGMEIGVVWGFAQGLAVVGSSILSRCGRYRGTTLFEKSAERIGGFFSRRQGLRAANF